MNKKERAANAIRLKKVDRIPVVYRGTKPVSEYLMKYYGFKEYSNFAKNYKPFLKKLGADFWGMGHNICLFSSFCPKYKGEGPKRPYIKDMLLYYTLGIHAIEKKIKEYDFAYPQFIDPPLGNVDHVDELKKGFLTSKLDLFDFNNFQNLYYYHKDKTQSGEENTVFEELKINHLKDSNEFLGLGTFNSPFIMCSYLRGMEQFLMDIYVNKKVAEFIVKEVEEFILEFNRRELEGFGKKAEQYNSWDDVADQSRTIMNPEIFQKYFLPVYQNLIENAKKYDLFFTWHCCGNVNEVLPMMIDAGIDMLNVVQTSAKDMQLERVYKSYGRDICFDGGIDVQALLVSKKPKDIKEEVKKAFNLWGKNGGIILGPSHEIVPGTPVENIFALFNSIKELN